MIQAFPEDETSASEDEYGDPIGKSAIDDVGRWYATNRDKYPKPELDDDEQADSDAEEESESESD